MELSFQAYGKLDNDESVSSHRNEEIVRHMSKVCLETFREEDKLIGREMESTSTLTSTTRRRMIRIDDIEIVDKQKGRK
jgi:hypothetical protein